MRKIYVLLLLLSMLGCSTNHKFTVHKSNPYIAEIDEYTVYDKRTNVVYYTSALEYGYYSLSPMYDVNGSIMTLEKFNKLAK